MSSPRSMLSRSNGLFFGSGGLDAAVAGFFGAGGGLAAPVVFAREAGGAGELLRFRCAMLNLLKGQLDF